MSACPLDSHIRFGGELVLFPLLTSDTPSTTNRRPGPESNRDKADESRGYGAATTHSKEAYFLKIVLTERQKTRLSFTWVLANNGKNRVFLRRKICHKNPVLARITRLHWVMLFKPYQLPHVR
ncbi:unnamed protein product [Protopolystoma xenopodis]|uniref:Uncharacterized protein n=1 Tax=Protopolystoma xenopodis TaxID=117903 RepID=A0A3S5C1A5_9PLAT|nr:unnamed protein product [Protopolystoma xenopodis]